MYIVNKYIPIINKVIFFFFNTKYNDAINDV